MSKLSFRAGWFRGARKVWHCLALHMVADDTKRTMKFTVAIPWIMTVVLEVPLIPSWLGGTYLTGGKNERAEFGLWHDYHEFKLQWRRIIDLSGKRGGWEHRHVHKHGKVNITKTDSLITNTVYEDPFTFVWVKENQIDRWAFEASVWHVPSKSWYIPDLYDYVFTLKAQQTEGKMKEVWLKQTISRKLMPLQIFQCLTKKLKFD
jgi:hypothetical protein